MRERSLRGGTRTGGGMEAERERKRERERDEEKEIKRNQNKVVKLRNSLSAEGGC